VGRDVPVAAHPAVVRGGQVPDHGPQARQVERLVVQRRDGVLEFYGDVPLLDELGLEPGLHRPRPGQFRARRRSRRARSGGRGWHCCLRAGHGYLRARQYPFGVRLRPARSGNRLLRCLGRLRYGNLYSLRTHHGSHQVRLCAPSVRHLVLLCLDADGCNYWHEMIDYGRYEQEAGVLYPKTRLAQLTVATRAAGLGALLLTPGPDLRYATGYAAHQLERLTCLAVPADGDPFLVVPNLELPAARASRAGQLDLEIIGWDETDDPYELVAARLRGVTSVGLADRMWALMTLRLREVLPGARQELASRALRELRARKDPAEIEALLAAGQAIDR